MLYPKKTSLHTPLTKLSKEPLTLARYMEQCLHSFYGTQDPLGAHFITAPEISQMFGELLGAWAIDVWQQAKCPTPFHWIELGAGRGTLMADMMRTALQIAPDFLKNCNRHLVENSPVLANLQQKTLSKAELDSPFILKTPTWHKTIATVPSGFSIIIANEFFDALPIHQFCCTEQGWKERGIDDGKFCWMPPGPELSFIPLYVRNHTPRNGILEVSPLALKIMDVLAHSLMQNQGALILIDYGYTTPPYHSTLQAVRENCYHNPLEDPGSADLTSLVDFNLLAARAQLQGATVQGPLHQGTFLRTLGINERAASLKQGKTESIQIAIDKDLHRLIHSEEMGDLFKVMVVTSSVNLEPVFRDRLMGIKY